jgi:hypothetical protein
MDPVVGVFQLFLGVYSNWQNRHRKSPVPDVDSEALEISVEAAAKTARFRTLALIATLPAWRCTRVTGLG